MRRGVHAPAHNLRRPAAPPRPPGALVHEALADGALWLTIRDGDTQQEIHWTPQTGASRDYPLPPENRRAVDDGLELVITDAWHHAPGTIEERWWEGALVHVPFAGGEPQLLPDASTPAMRGSPTAAS